MLIDRLCEKYGESALVAVRPYVDDDGETLRWIVEIDGREVSDLDVRVTNDPVHPQVNVLFLVGAGEEMGMGEWNSDLDPHGPAAFVRSLRDLRRSNRG